MNLQIDTITLKDGGKMDVIRDIETVRKLVDELNECADALRALHDLQNGPPLLRQPHQNDWNQAMNLAHNILKKLNK